MDDFMKTVLGVALILATTLMVCYTQSLRNDRAMAEKGYTQTTLPGQGGIYWVKP